MNYYGIATPSINAKVQIKPTVLRVSRQQTLQLELRSQNRMQRQYSSVRVQQNLKKNTSPAALLKFIFQNGCKRTLGILGSRIHEQFTNLNHFVDFTTTGARRRSNCYYHTFYKREAPNQNYSLEVSHQPFSENPTTRIKVSKQDAKTIPTN